MNEIEEFPVVLIDADLAPDPAVAVRAALQEAIRRAGTQQKLVDLINLGAEDEDRVERGHLSYWLRQGIVPEKHCGVIEIGTGVSRRALCPRWRRVWLELVADASRETEAAEQGGEG